MGEKRGRQFLVLSFVLTGLSQVALSEGFHGTLYLPPNAAPSKPTATANPAAAVCIPKSIQTESEKMGDVLKGNPVLEMFKTILSNKGTSVKGQIEKLQASEKADEILGMLMGSEMGLSRDYWPVIKDVIGETKFQDLRNAAETKSADEIQKGLVRVAGEQNAKTIEKALKNGTDLLSALSSIRFGDSSPETRSIVLKFADKTNLRFLLPTLFRRLSKEKDSCFLNGAEPFNAWNALITTIEKDTSLKISTFTKVDPKAVTQALGDIQSASSENELVRAVHDLSKLFLHHNPGQRESSRALSQLIESAPWTLTPKQKKKLLARLNTIRLIPLPENNEKAFSELIKKIETGGSKAQMQKWVSDLAKLAKETNYSLEKLREHVLGIAKFDRKNPKNHANIQHAFALELMPKELLSQLNSHDEWKKTIELLGNEEGIETPGWRTEALRLANLEQGNDGPLKKTIKALVDAGYFSVAQKEWWQQKVFGNSTNPAPVVSQTKHTNQQTTAPAHTVTTIPTSTQTYPSGNLVGEVKAQVDPSLDKIAALQKKIETLEAQLHTLQTQNPTHAPSVQPTRQTKEEEQFALLTNQTNAGKEDILGALRTINTSSHNERAFGDAAVKLIGLLDKRFPSNNGEGTSTFFTSLQLEPGKAEALATLNKLAHDKSERSKLLAKYAANPKSFTQEAEKTALQAFLKGPALFDDGETEFNNIGARLGFIKESDDLVSSLFEYLTTQKENNTLTDPNERRVLYVLDGVLASQVQKNDSEKKEVNNRIREALGKRLLQARQEVDKLEIAEAAQENKSDELIRARGTRTLLRGISNREPGFYQSKTGRGFFVSKDGEEFDFLTTTTNANGTIADFYIDPANPDRGFMFTRNNNTIRQFERGLTPGGQAFFRQLGPTVATYNPADRTISFNGTPGLTGFSGLGERKPFDFVTGLSTQDRFHGIQGFEVGTKIAANLNAGIASPPSQIDPPRENRQPGSTTPPPPAPQEKPQARSLTPLDNKAIATTEKFCLSCHNKNNEGDAVDKLALEKSEFEQELTKAKPSESFKAKLQRMKRSVLSENTKAPNINNPNYEVRRMPIGGQKEAFKAELAEFVNWINDTIAR